MMLDDLVQKELLALEDSGFLLVPIPARSRVCLIRLPVPSLLPRSIF